MEYLVFDARGNGEGGVVPTLTGDHLNRGTDYTAIVEEIRNWKIKFYVFYFGF